MRTSLSSLPTKEEPWWFERKERRKPLPSPQLQQPPPPPSKAGLSSCKAPGSLEPSLRGPNRLHQHLEPKPEQHLTLPGLNQDPCMTAWSWGRRWAIYTNWLIGYKAKSYPHHPYQHRGLHCGPGTTKGLICPTVCRFLSINKPTNPSKVFVTERGLLAQEDSDWTCPYVRVILRWPDKGWARTWTRLMPIGMNHNMLW